MRIFSIIWDAELWDLLAFGMLWLLMKLQEAEDAVKDGEGWLDLDELKALMGE